MYCRFCGKKLEEGQLCDCPESVADRAKKAQQAAQQNGDAVKMQPGQQDNQSAQQNSQTAQQNGQPTQQAGQAAAAAKNIFAQLGSFLGSFFRAPVDTILDAVGEQSYGYQYLIGAFFLLFILLIPWTSLAGLVGGKYAFLMGLLLMVIYLAGKLLYTVGLYFYYDKGTITFGKALAITCESAAPETMFLLLLWIFNLTECVPVILFFYVMVRVTGLLSEGLIIGNTTGRNCNRAYWITLLVHAVCTILMMILVYAVLRASANYALDSIGSLFGF